MGQEIPHTPVAGVNVSIPILDVYKRQLHMHVGKEINISLIAGEELNIQVYKNVYKLKLGTDLLLRIEE